MWWSFFLFLTVFPQPFTGQMDTPSPHSIEWDGIKHLWEEKEPGQASCVLILIDTVYNYTMLVDSWIIICCITNKQPGYSEVSGMVSSLVELWTHFKYTLSWRRLKYCIYMVFSWGIDTTRKREKWTKTMLASRYKFSENSRIFQKLYLNLTNYIFSTFERARHLRETAK